MTMTISIKALTVKKGKFEKVMNDNGWTFAGTANLEGRIKLELSEGIVTGSGEIHVADISEKLQNKLYDLLGEIENELNGVSVKPKAHLWDSTSSLGTVSELLNKELKTSKNSLTDSLTTFAALHNGERVLTSDALGNVHVKSNVEFSNTKNKQSEEDSSHETDKDENEHINQALNELGKIINIVFNFSPESDTKQVAKKLSEKIKEANGKF